MIFSYRGIEFSNSFLYFDLQPQFKYMNYFIYTSHHFTPHGRYELNKLASLPMCGFIAQLVEHRTGIAEVTGSNPVEALIFFRLLLSNRLNWKIYCDDHSSLSRNFCSLENNLRKIANDVTTEFYFSCFSIREPVTSQ